jgi:ubiquinone/menaquinone biosynthesis C-methylase UbiE
VSLCLCVHQFPATKSRAVATPNSFCYFLLVETTNPPSHDWVTHARMSASTRWERPSAEMGRGATEAIVSLALPHPGMRVLDVAGGTGAPSLQIARAVAPTGHVTATDLSPEPLKIAAERARQRGLTNISFEVADVHHLSFPDASFDLVTSRCGVMFFSDLPRALTEMRRVLKPGGRVALLAWGPIDQPYFQSTGQVIMRHTGAELPPAAQQIFKFGERGTLTAALTAAGFREVQEELRTVPWVWPASIDELWLYYQAVTIPFRPVLELIRSDQMGPITRDVHAAFARYWDGEKVNMTADFVLAAGTR